MSKTPPAPQAKSASNLLYKSIYDRVRQIPFGKVATYGQIADLLGLSGHARQVGYALFRVDFDTDVPWHRVINAQGKISRSPLRQGGDDLQRHLLEQEGIIFDAQDRINLQQNQWHPSAEAEQ